MRCCSYPGWHVHYPAWLRMGDAVEPCKCGHHPRQMTVETLLQAWKARHH